MTANGGGSGFGLREIGQIGVVVQDVGRAVEFYREVLGMRLLFEAGGMAFFDCGGVRLMLGVAERAEFDHPASILYYRVADIGAAYEALRARGVQFEGAPHVVHRASDHDLWMAFFRDMDENLLALMSEVGRE